MKRQMQQDCMHIVLYLNIYMYTELFCEKVLQKVRSGQVAELTKKH